MTDQEKKSGGGSGASVVIVEKTASSRHKPYRPTELEEAAPDLHNRSRAPAVPSVAEELKDTTLSETISTAERVEKEHAVSSDKHMHETKKISSSKRRGSSPEEIAMVLKDAKKDPVSTAPIPARVETVVSEESKGVCKRDAEKKADDDSITEEMAEMRTCDATKEHSEWITPDEPTHSYEIKKKGISCKEGDFNKVENVKSQAAVLEGKASVGPCFKPNMLYGGPSGIAICVPKKSLRSMKEECTQIQLVINFNVSKKVESKSASHIGNRCHMRSAKKDIIPHIHKPAPKKLEKEFKIDQAHPKLFEDLKGKLDNMTSKIRNLLNV